jgi:atypical dual specificity phosphatase
MKMSWVEDGILAASSLPVGLTDLRWLQEQGVRAILTLTQNPLTTHKNVNMQLLESLDMLYCHAPVLDGEPPDHDVARYSLEFLKEMRKIRRPTLVHCQGGVARTGTLLHLNYLMQGETLDAVKERIEKARSISSWMHLSESQQAFLIDVAANGLHE